jgi:hypothetical protein
MPRSAHAGLLELTQGGLVGVVDQAGLHATPRNQSPGFVLLPRIDKQQSQSVLNAGDAVRFPGRKVADTNRDCTQAGMVVADKPLECGIAGLSMMSLTCQDVA